MRVHLLMTPEIGCKKPSTAKILHDFGQLEVMFGDALNPSPEDFSLKGLHCVVEDSQKNLISWLKQFDGIPIGNGSPFMEQFEIKHIKI